MSKNQWSGMIMIVVVLALAVGFMGGSLYEKRNPQTILNGVDNKMKASSLKQCSATLAQCLYEKRTPEMNVSRDDDAMQVWLRKCRALRAGMDDSRCVITGQIE